MVIVKEEVGNFGSAIFMRIMLSDLKLSCIPLEIALSPTSIRMIDFESLVEYYETMPA